MSQLFESIFLGILQGLTEFLPISSSAHLRIAGAFFSKAQDPGARFTAITQIGTELAVLIFFRNDIKKIIVAWFTQTLMRKNLSSDQKSLARMGWLIIIGSLPVAILGYVGKDIITKTFSSYAEKTHMLTEDGKVKMASGTGFLGAIGTAIKAHNFHGNK